MPGRSASETETGFVVSPVFTIGFAASFADLILACNAATAASCFLYATSSDGSAGSGSSSHFETLECSSVCVFFRMPASA